ncbi:MAG: hypothetical protein AAF362_20305 [Pseudomonadota bacterium]
MADPVYGISALAPRITSKAIWLALRYVGLPLLAGLVLFDILVWWIASAIWDVCIGLWCWI